MPIPARNASPDSQMSRIQCALYASGFAGRVFEPGGGGQDGHDPVLEVVVQAGRTDGVEVDGRQGRPGIERPADHRGRGRVGPGDRGEEHGHQVPVAEQHGNRPASQPVQVRRDGPARRLLHGRGKLGRRGQDGDLSALDLVIAFRGEGPGQERVLADLQ